MSDEGLVTVRVQPRARRNAVKGVDEAGVVRIAVKAPPVDGAANTALLKFLGRKVLGVAPSTLRIVRGESRREKVVGVRGLDADQIRARIEAHLRE